MIKPILTTLFFCLFLVEICLSQRTYYSSAEGDFFTTAYNIIGKVKNNIVIWKNNNGQFSKSQIIVFDDKMRILNRVNTKALKARNIFQYAFVNQRDSFQLIFQALTGDNVVCRMATFDENGNYKHEIILDSYKAVKSSFGYITHLYQFISSSDKQKFALLKISPDADSNRLILTFKYCNSDGIREGSVVLPFNKSVKNLFPCLLDDNNNLLLLEGESVGLNYKIFFFKTNLINGAQENTVRILNETELMPSTLKFFQDRNKYFIFSEWKKTTNISESNLTKNTGVFCWQLTSNLEDSFSDTLLSNDADVHWYQQNLNFLKLQQVAGINISTNTFITKVSFIQNEQNDFPAINFSEPSLPSFNDLKVPAYWQSLPSVNGVYKLPESSTNDKVPSLSNTNQNGRRINKLLYTGEPFMLTSNNLKLFYVNLNSLYQQGCINCYDDSIRKKIITIMDKSKIVETKDAIHILYTEYTGNNSESNEGFNFYYGKNKQLMNDIKLMPNGTYSQQAIMLMNLKYKTIVQRGVQVSPNTIVFPCLTGTKLAFLKIDLNQ